MSHLQLSSISFGYTDALTILQDISFSLNEGWTGIVGPNGGGKTTLLRLIAGELKPVSGSLRFNPPTAKPLLVEQRVEPLTSEIEAFSMNWENEVARIRARLELDPDEIYRWGTLSPGERKRWQIGAALALHPEVLLLDEPTNHLDADARKMLMTELSRYEGIGLLVSHDRNLLDSLTKATLRVESQSATLYSGNYSAARVLWEQERLTLIEKRDQIRTEKKRLDRTLAEVRRSREHAEKQMNRGRRITGPRDHDHRSAAAKGRIVAAEGTLGKQTGVMRRRVEKTREELKQVFVKKNVGASVSADYEAPRRSLLIEARLEGLSAGNRQLLGPTDIAIRRGDRIHLAGRNGCGKTTLMQELIRRSGLPRERMLFLPQDLTLEKTAALIREMRALPEDILGRVMQIVAALGVEPAALLASDLPSPGQARKLMLALGLGRQVWLAILDEPTNHMDLPSIERLEEALQEFPGALLLVTHDTRFAEALTEVQWQFEEGRLMIVGMTGK